MLRRLILLSLALAALAIPAAPAVASVTDGYATPAGVSQTQVSDGTRNATTTLDVRLDASLHRARPRADARGRRGAAGRRAGAQAVHAARPRAPLAPGCAPASPNPAHVRAGYQACALPQRGQLTDADTGAWNAHPHSQEYSAVSSGPPEERARSSSAPEPEARVARDRPRAGALAAAGGVAAGRARRGAGVCGGRRAWSVLQRGWALRVSVLRGGFLRSRAGLRSDAAAGGRAKMVWDTPARWIPPASAAFGWSWR